MDYHVPGSEYPVEFQVLVRLDEGLGAGRLTHLAVDRLSGRVRELLQAFPPDDNIYTCING